MSADLAAYLRARLDEKEASELAKRRVRDSTMPLDCTTMRLPGACTMVEVNGVTMSAAEFDELFCEPCPDPDVLADIESKRRILEQVEHTLSYGFPAPRGMASEYALAMCVLDLMAQPYAGRDDFNPAWSVS